MVCSLTMGPTVLKEPMPHAIVKLPEWVGRSMLSSLLTLANLAVGAADLSPRAQALVQRAFEGMDASAPVVDVHVHVIGFDHNGNDCEVNSALLSPWHPFKEFTSSLYFHASGVRSYDRFDQEYMERLITLARGFGHPVRLQIMAMDHCYHPDGTLDRERTQFYVPNDYVVRLAEQHPDLFVPVISVHPARTDALAELENWSAKGVRYVKWLPNAQGIDPADPRYDPFFQRMRELGMVLISHTGEEQAVPAKGAQALGNPLRLRRALDAGVTVIMAHCASLGTNEDLDHPGRKARNFDLFLRLMGEARYRGRLFGDLAAITQINRAPRILRELLSRRDLQDRLVDGSDYPLPGVNLVIWTSQFKALHMITGEERKALDELFHVNPLLFDFVLKRTIQDPRTGQRFDPGVFLRIPVPEGTIL
jgi:uncharacterized protein